MEFNNYKNNKKRTLLHISIINKEYDFAIKLLEEQILNINDLDYQNCSALIYLLRNIRNNDCIVSDKELEIFTFMIKNNIDLDINNLNYKCARNYIAEIKEPILFDIIYKERKWIYEDIILAIEYDNEYIFYKLLDHFTNNNISFDYEDLDGFTPLFHAIHSNNTKYCEEICKTGASIDYNHHMCPYKIAKMQNKEEYVKIMEKYIENNKLTNNVNKEENNEHDYYE